MTKTHTTSTPTKPAPAKAPAADEPKTPEQIREEAEAKSADAAKVRDGFAAAEQKYRMAADLVQALASGRADKTVAEDIDTLLTDGEAAFEEAIGLLPDDEEVPA